MIQLGILQALPSPSSLCGCQDLVPKKGTSAAGEVVIPAAGVASMSQMDATGLLGSYDICIQLQNGTWFATPIPCSISYLLGESTANERCWSSIIRSFKQENRGTIYCVSLAQYYICYAQCKFVLVLTTSCSSRLTSPF